MLLPSRGTGDSWGLLESAALLVLLARTARRTPPGGRGGPGLIELRERVEAVDGELSAGPLPGGGWQVVGVFPQLGLAGSRS
ncbi:hypothetical protein [Streptomyces sp. NPDC051211]|uniref:hypothetical protein n=1 Tax=Streptomyces sp. NPDC051211 TaxID=3154643 RepID=UPI00344B8FFF